MNILFDASKSSLIPHVPGSVLAEIQKNGAFHMQLFRGAVPDSCDTPYQYMLASRGMLWSYPDLSEETLTLLKASYQDCELKATVDRDFFELSIRDKKSGFIAHLLSWQFAEDWRGLSWVEFEACMVSWMAFGMQKLQALQETTETAQDGDTGATGIRILPTG